MRSALLCVVVLVLTVTVLGGCRRLAAYGASPGPDAADGGGRDARPDGVWRDAAADSALDAALDGGSDVSGADAGRDANTDGATTETALDGRVDTNATDTAPDGGALTAPFGTPQALAALNTTGFEDDPTLTADMLEIYFSRAGKIWRSSRITLAAGWDPPQQVTALNSASWDDSPEITPDGLTIFIASQRPDPSALGNNDIWVATRPSRLALWSAPVIVAALNSTAIDACAAPTPDALTVFFDSDRASGATGRDIYLASRVSATAPFAAPSPAPGLNGTANDQNPWIDATGTIVVFSSDRPGGVGGADLWIATRPNGNATFNAPQLLIGVNSIHDEFDPWLSPDLKTIYFCSTRSGTWDLYTANR